jgi:hypothetical protein
MSAIGNSNHKEPATSFRFVNTTGAALVANEFALMRGRFLMAKEAIASLAEGGLADMAGVEFEANTFRTGQATFAAADLAVYWDPTDKKFSNTATVGYWKIGYSKAAIASGILDVIGCVPVEVVDGVAELASALDTAESDIDAAESDIDDLEAVAPIGGKPFVKVVSLAAATAGTAVPIVTDEEVGAGNKIVGIAFKALVGGGTAWSGGTGTKVAIQDTNGTPVVGAEIAVAALTGNAVIGEFTANVTLKSGMAGFTTAKGISLKADNNFGAGSALSVTVTGFIVAAA